VFLRSTLKYSLEISREDILKLTVGNQNLPEMSNAKWDWSSERCQVKKKGLIIKSTRVYPKVSGLSR
jgi:hypothetical protein